VSENGVGEHKGKLGGQQYCREARQHELPYLFFVSYYWEHEPKRIRWRNIYQTKTIDIRNTSTQGRIKLFGAPRQ